MFLRSCILVRATMFLTLRFIKFLCHVSCSNNDEGMISLSCSLCILSKHISLSQVYEALYAAAQLEPLNTTAVSEGYSKYLKYVQNRPPSLAPWGGGIIKKDVNNLNNRYTSRL